MKNLVHIPLDTLDNLPSKPRRKSGIKNYRYCKLKDDDHYVYRNTARNKMYDLIWKLVCRSVGRKWDEVYSDIKHITRHLPYAFWGSEQRWFMSFIHIDHEGDWWASTYRGSLELFDKWYGHYWRGYLLYVHPETGIICKRRRPRERGPRRDDRKMYQRITQSRKSDKKHKLEKDLESLREITLINNNYLYSYFRRLGSERTRLMGEISNYERYEEGTYEKGTSAYYFQRYSKRQIRKYKEEYYEVIDRLNEVLKGDLKHFYRSQEYKNSIPRECHHFDTTLSPKQKKRSHSGQ